MFLAHRLRATTVALLSFLLFTQCGPPEIVLDGTPDHPSSESSRSESDDTPDERSAAPVDDDVSPPEPDDDLPLPEPPDTTNPNQAPRAHLQAPTSALANAGVTLDATESSDEDGDVLHFAWRQVSGVDVLILEADDAIATFVAPDIDDQSTLVFEVCVSDGVNEDCVHAEVLINSQPTAIQPTAHAGEDQRVVEGDLVTLDASTSDPGEHGPLAISWHQLDGPQVFLENDNEPICNFMAPSPPGSDPVDVEIELTVTDRRSQQATDSVLITVHPSSFNGGGGDPPTGGPGPPPGPQCNGCGPAAPQGQGPFVIDLSQRGPNTTSTLGFGVTMVNSPELAFALFEDSGIELGLVRVHVNVHDVHDDPAAIRFIAQRISAAHDHGARALLTMLGTPLHLASKSGTHASPGGIPEYAASNPVDHQAWVDVVSGILLDLEQQHDALPDYVEIWNEPDRYTEYWNGTTEEFLSLFALATDGIHADFGNKGVKVGGPGIARNTSRMDAEQPVLFEIASRAAEFGYALDFLSYHTYQGGRISNGYEQFSQRLDGHLKTIGLDDIELFCSEWNIYPSPDNHGIEFDGAHAAANLAAFLSASDGLDGSAMFVERDPHDPANFRDLLGEGMGLLTSRGIKKNSYRVLEFIATMSEQGLAHITYPKSEFAVGALASVSASGGFVVIGNDVVDPGWLWAAACRERGYLPGVLGSALQRTKYSRANPPTVRQLMRQGLTEDEANAVLEILPMVWEAEDLQDNARTIEFEFSEPIHSVIRVWRFDDIRNSPAQLQPALLPQLQALEKDAMDVAFVFMVDALETLGHPAPPRSILKTVHNENDLAKALKIPLANARTAWNSYFAILVRERQLQALTINDLPETQLTSEMPKDAGIELDPDGQRMAVTVQPNAVTVIEYSF